MEDKPAIDWSQFIIEMPFSEKASIIEEAWTTQSGIESWFLKSAFFKSKDGLIRNPVEKVKPGDTYTWMWHGWPDSMAEHGEILEPGEGAFFRFAFGKAGIVSVGFSEKVGEQILWLKQEKIPDDESGRYNWHVGCKTGWTFYLANLKSVIQGGPDLRNRNQALEMD